MSGAGHEHEFEPAYGLPEALPSGEKILWQGSPDFRSLAIKVFHMRKLTVYFFALLALRAAFLGADGVTLSQAAVTLIWPLGLALVGLLSVLCLAWLTARTTVYTLTTQRVVMRIGIVLTLTFNLPFSRIETADVKVDSGGVGDIAMRLHSDTRIAWLHLWPHARPWRVSRPEPTMRCLPEVQKVALLLAQAWSKSTGLTAIAVNSSQTSPDASPQWQAGLT